MKLLFSWTCVLHMGYMLFIYSAQRFATHKSIEWELSIRKKSAYAGLCYVAEMLLLSNLKENLMV